MGCRSEPFSRWDQHCGMRRGKNRLSLWESLLFAVSCLSLQHPHATGVLINLGDTGPWPPRSLGSWPPKPILPGDGLPSPPPRTLPQARCEREVRADVPAKHRPQPSEASLVPRHLERRGHLCACEACQGEERLGPASRRGWPVGWAGLLSILPLAVEELGGAGRRPQRSTREHSGFENKGSLRK